MQHLFRQLTEGLAVKGLIDSLDFRVFMAAAQRHGAVPLI